MSKRKMQNTGWVDQSKHPTGPNGRGLCRMCGEEVPKGRRTFCSKGCVHQYRLRNHHRYASGQLYKRDRGKCVLCGIDTYKVRRGFVKELDLCKQSGTSKCREEIEQRYIDEGWAPLSNRRWYSVDHILPVSEGGGPQDWPIDKPYENNLRTLCQPCHKKETAELRKRLKEARKVK
jgi:5-methylcytosine-specific restriction enzyme A